MSAITTVPEGSEQMSFDKLSQLVGNFKLTKNKESDLELLHRLLDSVENYAKNGGLDVEKIIISLSINIRQASSEGASSEYKAFHSLLKNAFLQFFIGIKQRDKKTIEITQVLFQNREKLLSVLDQIYQSAQQKEAQKKQELFSTAVHEVLAGSPETGAEIPVFETIESQKFADWSQKFSTLLSCNDLVWMVDKSKEAYLVGSQRYIGSGFQDPRIASGNMLALGFEAQGTRVKQGDFQEKMQAYELFALGILDSIELEMRSNQYFEISDTEGQDALQPIMNRSELFDFLTSKHPSFSNSSLPVFFDERLRDRFSGILQILIKVSNRSWLLYLQKKGLIRTCN